ncbi:MAG TPA: ROK family protein [Flavobacteriales bacterium]|nr:ROK family protein [Flavobacteriales bacterium]
MKIAAGIDIGGTSTKFGLVDFQGRIIDRGEISTAKYPAPEELVAKVCDAIRELLKRNNFKNEMLGGFGIGSPNGNYFTGRVEFAPNMNWKGVVPLADLFQKQFDVKAIVTNDANAAAIGEMLFGAAKGMNDFLFITLGTGLGSGIVANGEMIYGHDGFAGEIGHVIMDVNGRVCGCGRKRCLETYCSATGILKTYIELKLAGMRNESDAQLFSKETIDGKYIFQRAEEGEAEALEAFNKTGKILGLALANCVAFTSPQAIFLFGGLAQAGELIFEPTRKNFEANLLNIYKGKISILPSGLNESDAAILGAASLVFKYNS